MIFNQWHKKENKKIRRYKTIHTFTKRTDDKANDNNTNSKSKNNYYYNNSNNNNNNNNNNDNNNNNNNNNKTKTKNIEQKDPIKDRR